VLKSGLIASAAFVCSVSNRQVFMSGFFNYATSNDNPIIVEVNNVVNPNSVGNGGKTG
jgi:hypothetical protein